MKILTTTLILTIAQSTLAAEFSFRKHIPFLSPQAEYITAKLTLGNASHTCMVDTGARFTIGKESVLGSLAKVGETKGGGLSNMELKTDLVQSDITVGNWTIQGAIMGRTDRIPHDCLIGNDFFLNRVFEINFKQNNFVELETIGTETRPLDVYVSDRGGHFGFDVDVAGQLTKSIFDTGASQTVVDSKLVEANPSAFMLIKVIDVIDGNNSMIKAGLYRLDHFKFGDIEIANLEVFVLDLSALTAKIPGVNVVVGLDVIQRYNWFFDTNEKSWRMESH